MALAAGIFDRWALGHANTCLAVRSARRRNVRPRRARKLACEAWNQWMLGYKGPAQPSPALGDALNAGHHEVRCLGCDTHQTVALDIVRRPKTTTPIHELERYLRCKDCSEVRGYSLQGNHRDIRATKSIAHDPPPQQSVSSIPPQNHRRIIAAAMRFHHNQGQSPRTRSRSMNSSFDHRDRSNLVETDDGARKKQDTSCCGTESSGPRVRCRQARAPART
jgi:hypothetical protein